MLLWKRDNFEFWDFLFWDYCTFYLHFIDNRRIKSEVKKMRLFLRICIKSILFCSIYRMFQNLRYKWNQRDLMTRNSSFSGIQEFLYSKSCCSSKEMYLFSRESNTREEAVYLGGATVSRKDNKATYQDHS